MSSSAVAGGIVVGVAFVVVFSMFSIPSGFEGNIEDVTISLERTPCFGFCPDYTVTVFGNGTVVYEGRNFVYAKGEQRAQIAQSDVKELVDEFYRVGFFSMKDRYEAQVTDLPSQTTSITAGDATKSVYRYGPEPQRLVMLEDKIDEVAKTAQWVKGEG
ncbi:DUF6438 domain-containing protein [Nitrososphaera viennensis]|uniref:DUF6438 domain-containing protein n=1 Tax=Nitrososphaera viennensis EN76 TaxID=926571 RepID=A0A060HBN0_9ARCH|nr:DUF6438 domain-containing protein [Nitrososphaera viennensis]AIC14189.1 hypothetical protein NVIE_000070 [Nitrososphaera viennensis EN76]